MTNSIIGIIGHFAFDKELLDGQTVKTKTFYNSLKKNHMFKEIKIIDTFNWRKDALGIVIKTFFMLANCSNIIILLSQNGMRVFFPLLYCLNKVFHKRIHHIVIGGNLSILINNHKKWIKYLNSFDGNYVEAISIQAALKNQGLNNTHVLTNFKELTILREDELVQEYHEPFNLCTFSRVMKEKGIEDAIEAVIALNMAAKRTVFTLDIYGQVDIGYEQYFRNMMKSIPDFIKYKGIIPFNKSVETLKEYYLLLFPTYFDGEGFAGTLIDALSAGIPSIVSEWHCNSDVIEDYKTGRIIPVNDVKALSEVLLYFPEHPIEVFNMKKSCIAEAYKYTPEYALKPFIKELNNEKC
jgi:glycosyltransferase involved in cell wall biosynthesis